MAVVGIGINLSKIKKEQRRLMEEGKITKTKKGEYWLNLIQLETPNSQYNDYKLSESTTKEQRDAGNWGEDFGNGKMLGGKPNTNVPQNPAPKPAVETDPLSNEGDDDLPF